MFSEPELAPFLEMDSAREQRAGIRSRRTSRDASYIGEIGFGQLRSGSLMGSITAFSPGSDTAKCPELGR